MPICWRCKRVSNDIDHVDGWEFIRYDPNRSDEYLIPHVVENSNLESMNLMIRVSGYGYWLGLCPKCRLTEDQIRNMDGTNV